MEPICLLYTTFPEPEIAKEIAQKMIQTRMIACANVMASATSIYCWEGKVCQAQEVPVIFKTRKSLARKALEFLELEHPYQTPCIVTFKPEKLNHSFQEWVLSQTEPPGQDAP